MINATACYLRDGENVLLLNRNKGNEDIHNGLYVAPGGQTERGERGIDCMLREFEEETGLKLLDPKLRAIVTFFNQGRILGGKENPEDWCVEFYEANKFWGELKAENPKAIPMWIPKSELSNLRMHEGDRRIIELLREDGIYEVITQYSGEKLTRFDSRRVD